MNIDDKITRLQEIATKLEQNDISLEEGIKLFEEGSALAKECYTALNEAKGKITVIKKDLDTFKEENM